MSIKQNSIDFASEYPLAADVVSRSFYVDDCLSGADTPEKTIELHHQLMNCFERGNFLLRKWNSSDVTVLQQIPPARVEGLTFDVRHSSHQRVC